MKRDTVLEVVCNQVVWAIMLVRMSKGVQYILLWRVVQWRVQCASPISWQASQTDTERQCAVERFNLSLTLTAAGDQDSSTFSPLTTS